MFHDQRVDVSKLIEDFDRSIAELGLDREAFVFHAGPLIRKEKGYEYLSSLGCLKVYYDCGQSPVTNLLHQSFANVGCKVEFAQGVRPHNYKLFQIADLMCTLTLEAKKYELAERPTDSEFRFFGGSRAFKKEELKLLAAKRF